MHVAPITATLLRCNIVCYTVYIVDKLISPITAACLARGVQVAPADTRRVVLGAPSGARAWCEQWLAGQGACVQAQSVGFIA